MRRIALVACLLLAACGSSRASSSSSSSSSTAPPPANGFGTLASPCGAGSGNSATDVGVTDTEIHIGYGDDAGFAALAGGGHEMSDAVKALIKWCDDQGGINGRKVVGTYYDAKVVDVNSQVAKACDEKQFMLVGEGWTLDGLPEQKRLECGLPAFPTYGVNPLFTNASKMVAANPNPVDIQPVGLARWYAQQHPDKAKKAATVEINFAASLDTRDKQRSTWPKVGVTFIDACDAKLSLTGEPDYKPFVKGLQDCGAQVVSFIATPNPVFENFLAAAEQLDYHPDYLVEANFYDQQFAKWNVDDLAKTTYVRVGDVPLEYAAKNKATADYLRIVKANGGDVSDLGVHAASAFLLWATTAKQCGAGLTRSCVLDKAKAIHDWTGGGLSGSADVGANVPSKCEGVLRLSKTEWTQVYPEAGTLHCEAANVQPVTGDVVDKVHLGPDRLVHQ